jgi:rhomboid family GlyGly-CTERM serine protease
MTNAQLQIIGLCLVTLLVGIGFQWHDLEFWCWSRPAIIQGEYWRWLTGHFVHLGWRHALLNGIALLLITALWVQDVPNPKASVWLASLLFCMLGVSVGLWQWLLHLQWYVGLSGALHGLLVTQIFLSLKQRPYSASILLMGVIVKLVYEHQHGAMSATSDWIGGTVITQAHSYGAIAGVVFVGGLLISRWLKNISRRLLNQ